MQRLWTYLTAPRKRTAANRTANAPPKRRRTNTVALSRSSSVGSTSGSTSNNAAHSTRPLGPTELVLAAARMFPRNTGRVANLRAAVAANNLNQVRNAMAKLDAAATTAQEIRNLQAVLRGYEAWRRTYAPKRPALGRTATFSNLPAHVVARAIAPKLRVDDRYALLKVVGEKMRLPVGVKELQNMARVFVRTVAHFARQGHGGTWTSLATYKVTGALRKFIEDGRYGFTLDIITPQVAPPVIHMSGKHWVGELRFLTPGKFPALYVYHVKSMRKSPTTTLPNVSLLAQGGRARPGVVVYVYEDDEETKVSGMAREDVRDLLLRAMQRPRSTVFKKELLPIIQAIAAYGERLSTTTSTNTSTHFSAFKSVAQRFGLKFHASEMLDPDDSDEEDTYEDIYKIGGAEMAVRMESSGAALFIVYGGVPEEVRIRVVPDRSRGTFSWTIVDEVYWKLGPQLKKTVRGLMAQVRPPR